MKVRDRQHKAWVHVLDAGCPKRDCYWPRLDPGSYTQGVGYRHRSDDWLCGTREARGCPRDKTQEARDAKP